jgi:ATP-binding cassette subfamily F protein 3
LVAAYGEAVARFESLGGYAVEHRIEEIFAGLGLSQVAEETPLEKLSGGQRTRLGLARLLLAEPNLLLLDEPTNHLDIAALEWLERFLAGYRGGAIIVSHDWTFLDAAVSRILELDEKTHRVKEYAGNYSDYVAAKAREHERQFTQWQGQQDEIAQLRAAARHLRGLAKMRRGGKADGGDKFARGFFANRSRATVRRARQIEERWEHLLTGERVEKPRQAWPMKLEFGARSVPRGGQIVMTLDDLGCAFGERWLFRHTTLTLQHGERIALVGPNGSGKTTLLRLIAGEIPPTEGSVRIGSNVRIGYMPQAQEILDANATPLEIIRALAPMSETEARHFLHFFLFEGDDAFTRVGALSYGERARLLLARLVVSGTNCLLLDEPINHLDIPSRARFQSALEAFPGTVLIAMHDRAFIDHFATGIWAPRAGMVRFYSDREEMGRAK